MKPCQEVGKISIILVLIVSLIFGVWFYSGWPRIWQKPAIPPEIQEAWAATVTKTYSFPSNSESWVNTACGQTPGASCTWQSGDGSPANGSLEEDETRKGKSGTWTWQLSGITWESLEVPVGATVTDVDGLYNHRMATCTTCGTTNTSGNLLIRNSGDTATIATLETEVTYSGATSWATRNASGAQSIGASYQASNTGIILRITGTLATPNTTGARATLRQDEISLIITYTLPPNTDQNAFRWRNNDNNEDNATWKDTENTAITGVSLTEIIRVRLEIEETNGVATTVNAQLEFSSDATSCTTGTWTVLDTTTTAWRVTDSSWITNGDPTTNQLTSSGLTWTAGRIFDTQNQDTTGVSLNNQQSEWEWAIRGDGATASTVYRFRVTDAGTVLNTYTNCAQLTTAAPTVGCDAGPSTMAFPTLTTSAVETATGSLGDHASTTITTCTYGAGCTLSVYDVGDGTNPGLATSSPPYLIQSVTETLGAGSQEGYGLQATTTEAGTGGNLTISVTFDKTGYDVGAMATSTSPVEVASSTEPISNKEVLITLKAAIIPLTVAGNYEDIITFSCLGN